MELILNISTVMEVVDIDIEKVTKILRFQCSINEVKFIPYFLISNDCLNTVQIHLKKSTYFKWQANHAGSFCAAFAGFCTWEYVSLQVSQKFPCRDLNHLYSRGFNRLYVRKWKLNFTEGWFISCYNKSVHVWIQHIKIPTKNGQQSNMIVK